MKPVSTTPIILVVWAWLFHYLRLWWYSNQKHFQVSLGYMMPTDAPINDSDTAVTRDQSPLYNTRLHTSVNGSISLYLGASISDLIVIPSSTIKPTNVSGLFLTPGMQVCNIILTEFALHGLLTMYSCKEEPTKLSHQPVARMSTCHYKVIG